MLNKIENKIQSILLVLIAIVFILFNNINTVHANTPPHEDAVPGGIAIINLKLNVDQTLPYVTFNKKRVMVQKSNNAWHAVVGLPLNTKAGRHFIKIKSTGKKIFFNVKSKKYKTQYLTIKNKRKVNPNKKDIARIIKEKKVFASVFKSWREIDNVNTHFSKPVDGPFSSPFGLKRFFNKQPRRPHSGLDIAASEGTTISAPAAGIVSNTGDYFFNGQSVFIDHGQGLISMYCHMSKISVKAGQQVKQGEKIGEVGMTGRVTGPHLHWSVNLNNTRIDPVLFLK